MNQIPDPTFGFWPLLFSGFAFIGLFYSVKLLVNKGNSQMGRVLGLYLILQSITLLEYVLYWTNLIYHAHGIADISLLFPLLFGPLLLIYLDKSFANEVSLRKYAIHFVPFVLLFIVKLPFYLSTPELKFYHTHHILFGKYFEYYPWVKVSHMTLYSVLLYTKIGNQSGVGFMRSWARWMVGFFSLYVVLSALYQALVEFNVLTPQLDYFISLATCSTIFFVAWYGMGFETVARGFTIMDSLTSTATQVNTVSRNEMIIESSKSSAGEKYRNSGLPKSLKAKLSQDLEALMQDQQLYKQNDLRLESLAEKMNTSKHFVSQVINEVYKANFFEYINLKRIEEAKMLLRSRPKQDLNIIEVAYEVGFSNKGTFNSVFKRITGLTPTEFRNKSKHLLDPHSN